MKFNWKALIRFFCGIFKSKMDKKLQNLLFLKKQVIRELCKLHNNETEEFLIERKWYYTLILHYGGIQHFEISFKINTKNDSIEIFTSKIKVEGNIHKHHPIYKIETALPDLTFFVYTNGVMDFNDKLSKDIPSAIKLYGELLATHA